MLLVAHSPTHGLVPICLPVSDAPVPCLVIHLLNHWGPPSLPKTKSQVLSGKQSSTGWGYSSHLMCGQHFTVYKTRPPLLADTYYSNGSGSHYPMFRRAQSGPFSSSPHLKGTQTSSLETIHEQTCFPVSFSLLFFTSRVNYLNYFTARERDR